MPRGPKGERRPADVIGAANRHPTNGPLFKKVKWPLLNLID
jgi:hypothetical protein